MKIMLRIFVIAVLLTLTALGSMKAQTVTALPADSIFISDCLYEGSRQPQSVCLPLFFARKFIGRPYVAHTLEVNDDERLVVNTRQLDCTTLVETVAALTLCVGNGRHTYSDYIATLESLRYRGGILDGYVSRIHYFSEWIDDNTSKGYVTEAQQPRPPFSAVQTLKINYMGTHPNSYKALKNNPSLVPGIKKMEKTLTGRKYRYIPKSKVANTKLMRSTVKDGDIIAITCNKAGLDIAHLGFAVWREDGLHLLNASMIHKKVVEEPMTLRSYLQKHPSHRGIRIVRITGY